MEIKKRKTNIIFKRLAQYTSRLFLYIELV